jgi:hypothetical protein
LTRARASRMLCCRPRRGGSEILSVTTRNKRALMGVVAALAIATPAAFAISSSGSGSPSSTDRPVTPADVRVTVEPGGSESCPLNPDPNDPSDVTERCFDIHSPPGVSPGDPAVQEAVQEKVCQELGAQVAEEAPYNMDCSLR